MSMCVVCVPQDTPLKNPSSKTFCMRHGPYSSTHLPCLPARQETCPGGEKELWKSRVHVGGKEEKGGQPPLEGRLQKA